MRYPEILGHPCGYTSFSGRSTAADDPDRDVVYTAVATTFHVTHADPYPRERFSLNNVVGKNRYTREVLEPMCAIVRALGLDPSTATAADLEACDVRLRCATCAAEGQLDAIYGWDAAVSSHRPPSSAFANTCLSCSSSTPSASSTSAGSVVS